MCFEFDPDFEIGGSYGDGHAKSVMIHLDSCKPPAVGRINECIAKRYNKDGTVDDIDTIYGPPVPPPFLGEENLDVVAEYLRDFSVDIGYIEDSPGLDSFNTSMIRNLIFLDSIKVNVNFMTSHLLLLAKNEVITESGWVQKNIEVIEGVKKDTTNLVLIKRKTTDFRPTILTLGGVTAKG